jgi:hypothetical protein
MVMDTMIRGRITLREIFTTNNNWKRFLAWKEGRVRHAIIAAVTRMLLCRTPALGVHVLACENRECRAQRIIPHSCSSSICSSCGKARTEAWCQALLSDLLDVPYRHLVFTIPWELRLPLLDNWREGMGVLLNAAGRAILSLTTGHPKPLGRKSLKWLAKRKRRKPFLPGIIAVLHPNGDDLKLNPHVHVIVTCGGLDTEFERWVAGPRRYIVPAPLLGTEWKLRVLEGIRDSNAKAPWHLRRLRSDRRRRIKLDVLLGHIRKRRWKIRIGQSLREAGPAVRYACRYSKRPVLGEGRIVRFKKGYVTFLYKDYRQGGRRRPKHLPVLRFIERLTQHIPEKGFHKVRNYGLFAGAVRTKRLAKARQILAQRKKRRGKAPTWEQRRKAAGNKKPLSCPRCGSTQTYRFGLFGAPELIGRFIGVGPRDLIPPGTVLYPPKRIPPELEVLTA